MFERFTERARQAVIYAHEEVRGLNHNYLGTEHLLLGLLRVKEGLAARALESLGVNLEGVRGQIVRREGEIVGGEIPFTQRSKKVLELALHESLAIGHNYIGTEHILLGLVRENQGQATRILWDFNADADRVRARVHEMMDRPSTSGTSSLPTSLPEIPDDLREALETAHQALVTASQIAISVDDHQRGSVIDRAEYLIRALLRRIPRSEASDAE